jgi:hypothetical protein
MTILIILYLLAHLMYWVGEGATEGYTRSPRARRMLNLVIKPNKYDDPESKKAKGFASYNQWKFFSLFGGIFPAIISGFGLGMVEVSLLQILGLTIGITLIGLFVYGRIFNHVKHAKLFPQKQHLNIGNGILQIPRHRYWFDLIILGIGIAILDYIL